MPIFQDDLERELASREASSDPIPIERPAPPLLSRKLSEESIRTELCEGPIPDSPPPKTPEQESAAPISDRAELIERLKRGESPTWVPNRHLESIFHHHGTLQTPRSPKRDDTSSPNLLPAPTITPEKADNLSEEDRLQQGLNIERPRSALHSGDFTLDESSRGNGSEQGGRTQEEVFPSAAQPMSWIATSPPRDFTPFQYERRLPYTGRLDAPQSGTSSLSSSFSSSFIYKQPTSPLVQSEINEDIDSARSASDGINIAQTPRQNRRHTLTAPQSPPFTFSSPGATLPRQLPMHRREASLPYQAHQPRRSLTSAQSLQIPGSSPQTPTFLRSRRPSFSSDTSPLQHASMVGSYEESILRGRMSTTPSKPLEFLAQIGVLGMGKCKPGLRCPPHVSLSFPAVFYSYSTTSHGRSKAEDGPSPYVGQIDLENGLPNPEEETRTKRRLQNRQLERDLDVEKLEGVNDGSDVDARKQLKQKRRSGSPRAPPGGSYRIPEKGQIQIIIKNPNKTAVKLFLVPYDLTGMEPGTRTFIRQRSYSTGPIIDNLPAIEDAGRPTLRYLVHLNMCSPSRGRFYLYKNIRVVFANRVPDGKEKLRNEVTYPEPRYTPYKAVRSMHQAVAPPFGAPSAATSAGAALAAEKAYRRRSYGFTFGPNGGSNMSNSVMANRAAAFDAMDGVAAASPHHLMSPPPHTTSAHHPSPMPFSFGGGGGGGNRPVDPIPFRLSRSSAQSGDALPGGGDLAVAGDLPPPLLPLQSPGSADGTGGNATTAESSMILSLRDAPLPGSSSPSTGSDIGRYDKLSRGDVGYGGNAFVPPQNGHAGPAAAESLLSQRLRSLGVQPPGKGDEDGALE